MNIASKVTVIIPSLNPDEKLLKVVCGLEELGFDDIILVNDGSNEDRLSNFPSSLEHPFCTVLTHEVNRGKGAGLKTAFKYFLENREGRAGVVTVDGDAQHSPEDVLACCKKMVETESMVLGVRDFSLPHVPPRSRIGNKITSIVFRLCCGIKISDTQTGLRAIPTRFLSDLLMVGGERFEYETNMLLNMKTYEIPYTEQTIETVYIEENQTSHFRPIRDSIRIYSLILKFAASSLISAISELAVFFLLEKFFGSHVGHGSILLFSVISRLASSLLNFNLNRNSVFKGNKDKNDFWGTVLRYYIIAVPVMIISGGAVTLISWLLGDTAPLATTIIKAIVDIILFLVSFRIQREWVFSAPKH